jgi:hypothetical protein
LATNRDHVEKGRKKLAQRRADAADKLAQLGPGDKRRAMLADLLALYTKQEVAAAKLLREVKTDGAQ